MLIPTFKTRLYKKKWAALRLVFLCFLNMFCRQSTSAATQMCDFCGIFSSSSLFCLFPPCPPLVGFHFSTFSVWLPLFEFWTNFLTSLDSPSQEYSGKFWFPGPQGRPNHGSIYSGKCWFPGPLDSHNHDLLRKILVPRDAGQPQSGLLWKILVPRAAGQTESGFNLLRKILVPMAAGQPQGHSFGHFGHHFPKAFLQALLGDRRHGGRVGTPPPDPPGRPCSYTAEPKFED